MSLMLTVLKIMKTSEKKLLKEVTLFIPLRLFGLCVLVQVEFSLQVLRSNVAARLQIGWTHKRKNTTTEKDLTNFYRYL